MLRLRNYCRWLILGAILIVSTLVATQYYQCWRVETRLCGRFSLAMTVLVLICPLLYFLMIAIARYWFYHEVEPQPAAELPKCTVIIPGYNEGECVYHSIESVCRNGYPAEKLEVLAINDGSIDDTLQWMQRAAEAWPNLVRVIDFAKNSGKREALYRGIMEAKGEIIVTVDSDSLLVSDSLARMVAPFAVSENTAAVSGNVKVANSGNGVMPPMLDAGFTFGFDFIRSGQGVFGRVFCTPGALSAYRKSLLIPVLEEWREQTFMGRPAGIGEDRALTNLLLRGKYDVMMQRSAAVYTNVPESYQGMCKMLLRWERSNIRENLDMFKFIFKQTKLSDVRWWFTLITLLQYTQMMLLPVLLIWFSLYNVYLTEGRIFFSIIATTLIWSTLPAAINMKRNSRLVWYSYFYGLFHAFTLFWLVPYAFFTVGNSGWLTRSRAHSAGKM